MHNVVELVMFNNLIIFSDEAIGLIITTDCKETSTRTCKVKLYLGKHYHNQNVYLILVLILISCQAQVIRLGKATIL